MKNCLLSVTLLASTTAFGAQTFGAPGMSGRDAVRGNDGAQGQSQSVEVDGSAVRIAVDGEDGGSASHYGEDGSPASNCQQPFSVPFDLVGASGGNGGNGARGGHGGRGGSVGLHLKTEADLSKLKKITISNVGGRAGQDSAVVGRGAPGCSCAQSYWTVEFCKFERQRVENGQTVHSYDYRTVECRDRDFPRGDGRGDGGWGGHGDGRGDGRWGGHGDGRGDGHGGGHGGNGGGNGSPNNGASDWRWVLINRESQQFQCTSGSFGSNGYFGEHAQNGDYGSVSVYVGSGESPNGSSLSASVSQLVGKSFALAGYIWETRSGLRSLLASDSNVRDSYNFGKFNKRSVRFEWMPKKSPEESGVANATISAELGGTIASPSVSVSLPAKLTRKIAEQNGVTVVTITHVLNSTDPQKIEFCAKSNAKGSMVCEFSDKCVYENGDCLPR